MPEIPPSLPPQYNAGAGADKLKAEQDTKGTASAAETVAASLAASQHAGLTSATELQTALNNAVGSKVTDTTLSNLAADLKVGKNLTFDMVKRATLQATEKHHGAEAAQSLAAGIEAQETSATPAATTPEANAATEEAAETAGTQTPSNAPTERKSGAVTYDPSKFIENIASCSKHLAEIQERMSDRDNVAALEKDIVSKFYQERDNLKTQVKEQKVQTSDVVQKAKELKEFFRKQKSV